MPEPEIKEEAEQQKRPAAETDTLAQVELDTVLARRKSPRQRLLAVALITVAVLLALVPAWQALSRMRQQQPTTPNPVVNLTSAYIMSNVSYATVTLNGRKLAAQTSVLANLRPGANTLTLTAKPFMPNTCRLTLSGSLLRADTCQAVRFSEPLNVGGKAHYPAFLIYVSFGMNNLPLDERAPALDQITGALGDLSLSLRTIVPAGQHYISGLTTDGLPIAAVARQPMLATPVIALSPESGLQDCNDILCPFPNIPGSMPYDLDRIQLAYGRSWLVQAPLSLGWRFSSVTQTSLTTATAGNVMLPRGSWALTLPLVYDVAQGWSISPWAIAGSMDRRIGGQVGDIYCYIAAGMLNGIAPSFSEGTQNPANGIEGCALSLAGPTISAAGPPYHATFIARFGLVLAVDASAHQLIPQVPIASSAEAATASGGYVAPWP